MRRSLRLARSPRGARWVQCVDTLSWYPPTYALPSAGFVEPAPEFLCGTCKVPRVKITFRGVLTGTLTASTRKCAEHHKAFRIGMCRVRLRNSPSRSDTRSRASGSSGAPATVCRVTYPLPQRGSFEKDQPPCPVCRAPVVTAIEAGRPPWTLAINPECPSRSQKAEEKAARATARYRGESGSSHGSDREKAERASTAKAKKAATARKAREPKARPGPNATSPSTPAECSG